jgi:hypothetical protein
MERAYLTVIREPFGSRRTFRDPPPGHPAVGTLVRYPIRTLCGFVATGKPRLARGFALFRRQIRVI